MRKISISLIEAAVKTVFLAMIIMSGCASVKTEPDSAGRPFVPGVKSVETISIVEDEDTSIEGRFDERSDTDSANEVSKNKFNTIMVIAIVPGESQRKSIEDLMVKEFMASKSGAVASYQALLPGHEITKEFVEKQLKDTGVDAVLTLRLKDIGVDNIKDESLAVQPGADEALPGIYGGRDLYGYYHNMALPENKGDFNVKNRRVQIVAKLFALEDASQVWQGNLKILNESVSQLVKSIAQTVIKQLKEQEFIK